MMSEIDSRLRGMFVMAENASPLTARVVQLETELRRVRRVGMAAALLIGVILGGVVKRSGMQTVDKIQLVDSLGTLRMAVQVENAGDVSVRLMEGSVEKARGLLRAVDGKIAFESTTP